MKFHVSAVSRRRDGPVLADLVLLAVLLILPTGYEGALTYQSANRVRAKVLTTDESTVLDNGLVRSGEQRCMVRLLGGQFQRRTAETVNCLNGSLAEDKLLAATLRS